MISGTPTAAGTSSFTVQVVATGFDTQALTLTIDPVGGGGKKKKRDGYGSSAGGAMGSMVVMAIALGLVALRMRK